MADEITCVKLEFIKSPETEDYSAWYSILLNNLPIVVDLPIEEALKHLKSYLEEL